MRKNRLYILSKKLFIVINLWYIFIMKYEKIIKGTFIDRPNRFIALVEVCGETVKAHVKNTGRCRELLVPGAAVYLEDFEGKMGQRKMRYSLIGVEKITDKGILMVNMDSQAPNKVVGEALADGTIMLEGMERLTEIRAEKTFGQSRFDFYVEDCQGNSAYIEVKGVTLENDGIVRFPDAPTERGVKHINELVSAMKASHRAYIIFVIQMSGMKEFRPNDDTHPAFGDALRAADRAGVKVLAFGCNVTEDSLEISLPAEVKLS